MRSGDFTEAGDNRAKLELHLEGDLFALEMIDVQLPPQIATHLPFHIVDLRKLEHALAHNGPGLGVGVVRTAGKQFFNRCRRKRQKSHRERAGCVVMRRPQAERASGTGRAGRMRRHWWMEGEARDTRMKR